MARKKGDKTDHKVKIGVQPRPRKMVKQDITKEEFLTYLSKVSRPIVRKSKSDSKKTET